MPYIKFTNVRDEIIGEFSKNKLNEFSDISGAPLENIFIIQKNSKIVNNDKVVFIHVMWMPRSVEIENSVVKLINEFFKDYNYEKVCVYFTNMDKDHYYVGEL